MSNTTRYIAEQITSYYWTVTDTITEGMVGDGFMSKAEAEALCNQLNTTR